jgi:hypothetical protein
MDLQSVRRTPPAASGQRSRQFMATGAPAQIPELDDERTARVQRRTRQVLEAATRLMQKSGFPSMLMQSVATRPT